MSKLIFFLLLLFATGSAFAQGLPGGGGGGPQSPPGYNSLDSNWWYKVEFSGQTVITGARYDPYGVVETYTNTFTWPFTDGSAAINSTQNPVTASYVSSGTITIKVKWKHGQNPAPLPVCRLRLHAPIRAGATASGTMSLSSGIGSQIVEGGATPGIPQPYNKWAPDMVLRRVGVDTNTGEGELQITQSANVSVTDPMSQCKAEAPCIEVVSDSRNVTIASVNGAWPLMWKETQLNPINRVTSQGTNHNFSYMGRVSMATPIQYIAESTDYAKWELGLPVATQTITTYDLGNVIYEPATLEPRSIRLNGGIDWGPFGPQTPNSFEWIGTGFYSDSMGGSLPIDGLWDIPAMFMQIFPNAFIKQLVMQNGQAIHSQTTSHSLLEGEDFTYKLKFTFHDGVKAESIRDVTYHSPAEPTHFGAYFDKNLNGTWLAPNFDPPSPNDPFGVPGWATRGEENWPSKLSKPEDKAQYGGEIISLISAKFVGLIEEVLESNALAKIFTILTKQLVGFVNATPPPPVSYSVPRDQWDTGDSTYEIAPANWWELLTGSTSPPPDEIEALRTYIEQFHWKVNYRPTMWINMYTIDHFAQVGFTSRDIGDRKIENDLRASTLHYFFKLFPEVGGSN